MPSSTASAFPSFLLGFSPSTSRRFFSSSSSFPPLLNGPPPPDPFLTGIWPSGKGLDFTCRLLKCSAISKPRTQGIWPSGKGLDFTCRLLKCSAISRPRTQEYKDLDVAQNGMPVIKWLETVEEAIEKETEEQVILESSSRIEKYKESIRSMLNSMDDGEISVSAYDTAWVALVDDVKGSGSGPQFPSSLEWIAKNQLSDGSWGDKSIFLAHDRIINTLACVVALKSWNMHPDKREKGLSFIRDNINKLGDENAEHMPIGFEVAFPSLIDIARKLRIDGIPDDSDPMLQEIYQRRDQKLRRIPKDILQSVPTTLLHSLEGMQGLNWQSLIRLKFEDGSFLFSPSSTAFAVMETKDRDCLGYLTKIVEKFNGGVPNVYPVDMFEHIWAVDRLQRLGISRYFQAEIDECVSYVNRYWTEKGICWARNTRVHDIDDTAMGFRILRLHGYEVSPEVFKHFEKGGEFFCFAGQSNQAVTGMYNLYRASEVMFPGEKILSDAKMFSSEFLQEKRVNNELLDKWIITKDLPGEVGYALDVPWYASLPRVESRFYLEQYGGEDDVWIGKTLYRMSNVNNNTYLELGKLDYNNCQAIHQLEWRSIQKWYKDCRLGKLGLSVNNLLLAYYMAAATIFEPERSKERLAWAKTAALIETIKSHFGSKASVQEQEQITVFLREFEHGSGLPLYVNGGRHQTTQCLARTLLGTLNQLSLDAILVHGKDIHRHLRHAWSKWLLNLQGDGGMAQGEAELIVRTLNLSARGGDRYASEEQLLSDPKYKKLMEITNRVCYQIREFQLINGEFSRRSSNVVGMTSMPLNSDMQELVKLVLSSNSIEDNLDDEIKKTFLLVAKSFYYAAHCNTGTINFHIDKVLFERVL